MAKFKLTDGRIIDVDEDEIRDLVIAGAGEETDSESPSEMRARAKSEFAADWLAQKKLEAESIRDTPIGKAASAFFPRSVENEIIVRKLESELVVVDSSEYMITTVDLENAYSVRNKDSFYLPGLLILFLFLYFLL
jgi:hypothetical protein